MAKENNQDYTPEELQTAMFTQLVMMFASAAMHQMGKLVDPNSGKAEVNLEAAQVSIDMLDMLAAKTRGHLSADEEQLLKESLSSLKMTFVETQGSAPSAPPPAEPSAPPPGEIKPASDVKDQEAQPRFHKKY
ncbi:MAG: DUF1844 domain-containing protein [Verrucomicrobia bacterium]|nr:MAG: DUF1844 domain-containing protein [Verrucomicrobiota bacterium]